MQNSNSNQIAFQFNQSFQLRVIELDGNPWFVAKDVCDVLNLTNPSMALSNLDDDERAKFNLGRQGEANIINESGLYSLILTSRKPEAKTFKKWVTSEVLPSIRKNGYYLTPTAQDIAHPFAEEYITDAQYHELSHRVYLISTYFHHKGGASHAAWRSLRKEFNVELAKKLPARHFDMASNHIRAIEEQALRIKSIVWEAEKKAMQKLFKISSVDLELLLAEVEQIEQKQLAA